MIGDQKRFSDKHIITIIFSYDLDDYYIIEWGDRIKNNKNKLIQNISKSIIEKYVHDSKYLYNFYKYWKKENILLTPDKCIKKIIQEYKKIRDTQNKNKKYPEFLLKYLEQIEYKITHMPKKEQYDILNAYDDKIKFSNDLKEIIKNSIDDFFGLEENEENIVLDKLLEEV